MLYATMGVYYVISSKLLPTWHKKKTCHRRALYIEAMCLYILYTCHYGAFVFSTAMATCGANNTAYGCGSGIDCIWLTMSLQAMQSMRKALNSIQ